MNALLFALLLYQLSTPNGWPNPPSSVCATAARETAVAFLVIARRSASDTLATITVCLVTDTNRVHIAGYHGEVSLSSDARVVHVERPPGATRIENTDIRGRVSFAGVAPGGLPQGPLLSFTVARLRPTDDVGLRLTMLDVTDVDGRDAMARIQVDSVFRSTTPSTKE